MLFNSTLFLIFLPIVVWVSYQLTAKAREVFLLAASYFFYCVWSIPWSFLLLFAVVHNWAVALIVDRNRSRPLVVHVAMAVSAILNLVPLALFKYANFLSGSAQDLFGWRPWPMLDLVLPMGISFYTFQLMSYTIDVYRNQLTARRSLLDVALFALYFPQLVAGPIERAGHLIHQLTTPVPFLWDNIVRGSFRVMVGLTKKVFLADSLAQIAAEGFAAPDQVSGFRLLCATYAFAFQIYCDFSAYSDIAIGCGRMMGIELMENFKSPYLSASIRDFWRTWHISLSTWLRDYLFIPLGGSRHGSFRTYLNLMITMVLGGLWHGAGWNWVIWGGLQGFVLSVEKLLGVENGRASQNRGVIFVRWLITFHLVCLSWVFFRSRDVSQATLILKRIVFLEDGRVPLEIAPVFAIGAMLLAAEYFQLKRRLEEWCVQHPMVLKHAGIAFFVLLVFVFSGVSKSEFIYFQF